MTAELAQALATSTQLLILDARTEAEYTVSHLAGAQRVDITSDAAIATLLKTDSKDKQVVVYCSVGYRSAKVAQQLQQSGFQNSFNLEGGLFRWANEGRPIVHAEQPTQLVHPYNKWWGLLLKKQHRF